jgi:FAD/FMN-containing dehydrogenase
MTNNLKDQIKEIINGDILENNLEDYAVDKSIFKIKPQIVIFPKNEEDIKNLVIFAKENNLYLTPRSAGTDMSGGALTDSILLVFTKYFNQIIEINPQKKYVIVRPGVYFRDLEKELNKFNLFLPSYPASKEICAVGGMVGNDSGGEKTIKYGKTHDYVIGLNVILSDGHEYYFEKVSGEKLQAKLSQPNFEGEIYRQIYKLLKENYELIQKSKPKVSKNSAGYNIWDAYGRTQMDMDDENENGSEYIRDDSQENSRQFANNEWLDLTKLFVGSQGTLGIITKIKFSLINQPLKNKLAVIFLKSFKQINEILDNLLQLQPESLEITDDHTFKIFLKYSKEMSQILGIKGLVNNIRLFLPEIKLIIKNGLPKLIVLIEFADEENKINNKLDQLKNLAKNKKLNLIICQTDIEKEKYWKLRRDTYKLLREKIKDKIAAPFIDDLIVNPHSFSEFLPKLISILDKYQFLYTISGHLGDGNLHIIPLLDFQKEKDKILPAMEEIYDLTLSYQGSITAEHNDGLIRGWYLEKMFGQEIFSIFQAIKKIFDPDNIFNQHKKIQATKDYSFSHLLD